MDTYTVTCIALYENLARTHCVTCRIAAVAVNENLAVIHGIADCVLTVSVYYYRASVKICAERIARSALNGYFLAGYAAADITLSHSAGNGNILIRTLYYLFIEVVITYFISIYNHSACPPYFKRSTQ